MGAWVRSGAEAVAGKGARASGWLRRTAWVALLFFGLTSCGTWRAVPLYNVESGEEDLVQVPIRFREKGRTEKREVRVTKVRFPEVEGVDQSTHRLVRVDLRDVEELEIFDPRVGLSLLAVAGVLVLVVGVAFLIVMLTKESCPFVYAVTPEGLVFVGEAYSGATTRATQRPDLMPLPHLAGAEAQLLMTNQARETQYTDQLELWLVDHSGDVRAVSTASAEPILVGPARPASEVRDLRGQDASEQVLAADSRVWETDLEREASARDPSAREGLVATFAPPSPGITPVLELHAGNTPWMDLVFGRFFALFGDRLEKFLASSTDAEAKAGALAWRDREGVDLRVEVARGETWQVVAVVPPLGPFAMRRFAVPLPPQGPQETLRVRLSGGLGFWRVDAMELSELKDPKPARTRVAPRRATEEDGSDARGALAEVDGRYQVLGRIGQKIDLAFDQPAVAAGQVRDAFLFTHGYYTVWPPLENEQSLTTLRTLRDEPGSLSRFSLDLYRHYRQGALALSGAEAR